ncbi:NAD(P)-dependent dehydrogenase (short-subunit alcohol dehydrogenase family) [Bradyrhizobium sp. CIR18]|uniref:SDR family NAD(P)-dependent oxidoreductase n=1 Tax=Bradyrhizobium sp. CIR18 TaxID=2663839 RepID=UPI0016069D0A|nr:SDR family oxidoreductase [Bradyrhizobium sp. CIR18]MBB4367117.1 NAD(P)-dependent dehydrogenase (short-subunit alcohol dehydrogenase family) [Bradyrhizobium sp. CIR18]
MSDLSGKVALVTGGAQGMGLAIATRLKADGARVVISDISGTSGRAAASSDAFSFREHDVCDEEQWADVIGEIEAQEGKLDILVNNAGILGDLDESSPIDTTLENWRRVFAVNVEGVLLGCKAAIPAMQRSGGGAIVNISSISGLLATPYNTSYGASKAAVRHLTKTLAQYCVEMKLNIRCNSVHPGDVWTPLWEALARRKAMETGVSVEQIIDEEQVVSPMGGFTKSEDIASAVAFLASDESRRITGLKMIVDGGVIDLDTYHLRKHLNARRNGHTSPRPEYESPLRA